MKIIYSIHIIIESLAPPIYFSKKYSKFTFLKKVKPNYENFGSTFSKGGFYNFGSTFSKGRFYNFGSTFSKGGSKGGFSS